MGRASEEPPSRQIAKTRAIKDLWINRGASCRDASRECQCPSASGQALAPRGGRYSGRERPSFFIFQTSVERFIPKRAAAPFGPPTTQ